MTMATLLWEKGAASKELLVNLDENLNWMSFEYVDILYLHRYDREFINVF